MPLNITGIDQTISLLDAWCNTIIDRIIPEELDEAAKMFIQKAQSPGRCRVDTGFMRDNIKVTEKTPISRTVTSLADYSIYNEEGTRYMSASPFMFNSALELEQEFIGKLGMRIKTATAEHFKVK